MPTMSTLDPAIEKPLGCTCFRMRKTARAISRLYDQHLAQAGLKTTQYAVLAHAGHQALPVAALAERLGIERTTLTRNLGPLVNAGWIALRPGTDSRQRVVTLTAAGHAKVKSAYPAWRAAQADIEQLLGRDTVRGLNAQLDDTLRQLAPRIEELNHAHPE